MFNINSGLGQFFGKVTGGRVFVLSPSSGAIYDKLSQMFNFSPDGELVLHTTWASAIAATVAGRGDKILVSKGFVTAPTLAQLASMDTNGVISEALGGKQGDHYVTTRASATLPATTATPLFTVTGKVRLIDIVGEVTTLVQTQANNAKLIANPTVGADVDLCAVLDITAGAVGALFTITGTLATALVKTVSGAGVAQAAPLIITAGTIDLSCSATNTGATKWTVRYEPIDPGAMIIAA